MFRYQHDNGHHRYARVQGLLKRRPFTPKRLHRFYHATTKVRKALSVYALLGSATYTLEMKACIMQIFANNVSACRVGETIETVLTLANLTASNNVERLILAQRQLGEDLSSEKHQPYHRRNQQVWRKVHGYHVAGPDGIMMVFAQREIETTSAKETLAAYKDILRDIDDCSKSI